MVFFINPVKTKFWSEGDSTDNLTYIVSEWYTIGVKYFMSMKDNRECP